MPDDTADLLTVTEAAARRGVKRSTINKAITSGRLPAVAGFRGYRLRSADVDALVLRSHPSSPDSPYVSIAEAAELLGLSRKRVYVLMRDGRLVAAPDHRIDGHQSGTVRLSRADVEAFAAARRRERVKQSGDDGDEGE